MISLAIAALGLRGISRIALFLNFLSIDLVSLTAIPRVSVFVFVFFAHTTCFSLLSCRYALVAILVPFIAFLL